MTESHENLDIRHSIKTDDVHVVLQLAKAEKQLYKKTTMWDQYLKYKWQKILVLALGLLSLSVGGAYWWFYNATYQYCDEPYIDPTPITDCDRLVNDPEDPNRVVTRYALPTRDKKTAHTQCEKDQDTYPSSLRLSYQLIFTREDASKNQRTIRMLASRCYRRAITLVARHDFNSMKSSPFLFLVEILAKEKLHKAMALGGGDAFDLEADIYFVGAYNYKKDLKHTIDLKRRGAELGSLLAKMWVGSDYLSGPFSGERNLQIAKQYISDVADAGFGPAADLALKLSDLGTPISAEQEHRWKEYVKKYEEEKVKQPITTK